MDHFKVLIEFVTLWLLFYVLFFCPRGMWDLHSPTRDQTYTPCIGRRSLSHWTTREVPQIVVLLIFKDKWIRSGLTRGCWLTSAVFGNWSTSWSTGIPQLVLTDLESQRQPANESISTQHIALHAMKINEYLSNERRTPHWTRNDSLLSGSAWLTALMGSMTKQLRLCLSYGPWRGPWEHTAVEGRGPLLGPFVIYSPVLWGFWARILVM